MSLFCCIPLVLSGQWEERRREVKDSAFTPPHGASTSWGLPEYECSPPREKKKRFALCIPDAFFCLGFSHMFLAPWTQDIITRD